MDPIEIGLEYITGIEQSQDKVQRRILVDNSDEARAVIAQSV
jgi:hypothetical protein